MIDYLDNTNEPAGSQIMALDVVRFGFRGGCRRWRGRRRLLLGPQVMVSLSRVLTESHRFETDEDRTEDRVLFKIHRPLDVLTDTVDRVVIMLTHSARSDVVITPVGQRLLVIASPPEVSESVVQFDA